MNENAQGANKYCFFPRNTVKAGAGIKVCADKRFALLPKSMFVCVEMGEGGGVLGWGGGGEGRCKIWVSQYRRHSDGAFPLFHGQHFAGCPMLVKCHSV